MHCLLIIMFHVYETVSLGHWGIKSTYKCISNYGQPNRHPMSTVFGTFLLSVDSGYSFFLNNHVPLCPVRYKNSTLMGTKVLPTMSTVLVLFVPVCYSCLKRALFYVISWKICWTLHEPFDHVKVMGFKCVSRVILIEFPRIGLCYKKIWMTLSRLSKDVLRRNWQTCYSYTLSASFLYTLPTDQTIYNRILSIQLNSNRIYPMRHGCNYNPQQS